MQKDIEACYRLLEIGLDADPAAIRESYVQLVKIWHPDRFFGDTKLLLRAEEKLKQINLAYEAVMRHQGDRFSNSASRQPVNHESAPEDAEEDYRRGLACLEGKTSATNYQEATKWFLKAAEQKDGRAMYQLGLLHVRGVCYPMGIRAFKRMGFEFGDKIEAYKWLYLAIIYGIERAITYLERLNDAKPLTAADANVARMRGAYLFPEYKEMLPGDLLAELMEAYLGLMRDGKTPDGKAGHMLFLKLMVSFKGFDEILTPLAERTYEMARTNFAGLASSGLVSHWRDGLGTNEPDDLLRQCAVNLVCNSAGRLPPEFAILRTQRFNHIWVKEIMPGLRAQTSSKE